jgi:hypothetical protein
MRAEISRAADLLEQMDGAAPAPEDAASLFRILSRVQQEYVEIIKNALSLLMQDRRQESHNFLQSQRDQLDAEKEKISSLLSDTGRWQDDYLKLSIEYLYTRARLVDDVRMFPDFTLQLLERHTLDETLEETISYLEMAMTGKHKLFEQLAGLQPE